MPTLWKFFVLVVFVFSFSRCARSPIRRDTEAMRIAKAEVAISDDLNLQDLDSALKKNIAQLKLSKKNLLQFGPYKIEAKIYAESLEKLQKELADGHFLEAVQRDFVMLEVYGNNSWGDVFITSYFEPVIRGSRKPTKIFSQALYAVPDDMVLIRVREFSRKLPELFSKENDAPEIMRDGNLRGRLMKTGDGGIPQIFPYWTRGEIDSESAPLKKKARILAWVDPIDAFVLQIQGSGRVQLSSKEELRIGYAGQNGQPYVAIGQFLFDRIPKEKMSLQKIESYLRSLDEKGRRALMNQNPSYVFFTKIQKQPVTFFGNEVTNGRTIATDSRYFPKGALAFLDFPKPVFAEGESAVDSDEPLEFKRQSRFVFDQDTGGAIRGPGRVDLFWGSGPLAKRYSGVIKNQGRLYYLFPKAFLSM